MLRIWHALGFCLFVSLAVPTSARADVVCRLPGGITGFEVEREVAKKLLGAPTTDLVQAKVFLTVSQGMLYAETNYVSPGFDVPAKLAANRKLDLPMVVRNLLYVDLRTDRGEDKSLVTTEEIETLIVDQITFFVERGPIQNSIFTNLDFSRCKHIVWVHDRPIDVQPIRGQVNLSEELK